MKSKHFALIAALLASFCGSDALAAKACYMPAELHAEQLLRLHSELMVITVTCKQGSNGENLVPAYTGFTKNNIVELHNAEQVMINYYQDHGYRDGTEQLDKLRTKLGNEYGQEIADKSAPLFCGEKRDKVLTFYELPASKVEAEAQRMMTAEHSYVHACAKAAKVD